MSDPRNYSVVDQTFVNHNKVPTDYDKLTSRVEHHLDNQARKQAAFNHNARTHFLWIMFAHAVSYPFRRAQVLQYIRPDVHFLMPEIQYRFSTAFFMLRRESPLRIFRGMFPYLLSVAPIPIVAELAASAFQPPDYQFATHPENKYSIEQFMRQAAQFGVILAAQCALHPLRVAHIKLASDVHVKGLTLKYRYKTSLDCLARVVQCNGWQGLYGGLPFYILKSTLVWLYYTNRYNQQLADDERGKWARHEWLQSFWDYRYEIQYVLIMWGFNPLENFFTRMVYRIPTFKTDKLPKQFPKLWAPTFTGLISGYRGSIPHVILLSFLAFWYGILDEAWDQANNPPHAQKRNQHRLWEARWAIMQRERDEQLGLVPVYPRWDPKVGTNLHLKEQTTEHGKRWTLLNNKEHR